MPRLALSHADKSILAPESILETHVSPKLSRRCRATTSRCSAACSWNGASPRAPATATLCRRRTPSSRVGATRPAGDAEVLAFHWYRARPGSNDGGVHRRQPRHRDREHQPRGRQRRWHARSGPRRRNLPRRSALWCGGLAGRACAARHSLRNRPGAGRILVDGAASGECPDGRS